MLMSKTASGSGCDASFVTSRFAASTVSGFFIALRCAAKSVAVSCRTILQRISTALSLLFDGSLMVLDGSAEPLFRVSCIAVPGFCISVPGGTSFRGEHCSGFTVYLLHPCRPPPVSILSHPSASNSRTILRAPRSVTRALAAIDAIEGQHTPWSFA